MGEVLHFQWVNDDLVKVLVRSGGSSIHQAETWVKFGSLNSILEESYNFSSKMLYFFGMICNLNILYNIFINTM